MNKLFENEILNNWRGPVVLASIEETKENANLIIKYDDHGDEFIFVRMKDGTMFEYGYYLNRKGWPDEDQLELEWYKNTFVRNPKMCFKQDVRSGLANEIFFDLKWRFKREVGWREEYKKEYSKDYAQRKFNEIFEYFEKQKEKGIRFDSNSYKNDIINYLEANDIATEENLKRLNEAHFDTKINGVDGIAGKRKIDIYDGFVLHGDEITRIVINGKEKNPEKVSMKRYLDDDMFDRFALSLGQFR